MLSLAGRRCCLHILLVLRLCLLPFLSGLCLGFPVQPSQAPLTVCFFQQRATSFALCSNLSLFHSFGGFGLFISLDIKLVLLHIYICFCFISFISLKFYAELSALLFFVSLFQHITRDGPTLMLRAPPDTEDSMLAGDGLLAPA